MTKREVVVLSGVRTAIGTYGGSLKGHHLSDLAGLVVREAVARAGVNANEIGHSVFGHVVYSEPLAVAKDLDIPTEKLTPMAAVFPWDTRSALQGR